MPAAASMLLVCAGAADVRLVALKRWTPSRRLLSHILALVALPLASLALGMLAALAVYAIVVLFLVERLSLRTTVGITVLAIGGCWLLFEKLLSVPLPRSFFL
jgi:hypothetical protein